MDKLRGKVFRLQRRTGAIVVLAALLMTVMLGMAAFSIDSGIITLAKTQLQIAADAGALAGAASIAGGSAYAQGQAQAAAQANSVVGTPVTVDPTNDVVLGYWDKTAYTFTPLSGAALSSANAVQVTCTVSAAKGNQVKLFFAPIFGISKASTISVTSIATCNTINCGPFVGLNYVTITGGSYTDSYDSGTGAYNGGSATQNGNTCSNGNITLNGGSWIKGQGHPGKGFTVNAPSYVTGSTTPLTTALSEPAVAVGNAASSNNNNAIPVSAQHKNPLAGNGSYTLSGGDSDWLPPGTYYFSALTLTGSASITITGKTIIYVTGDINISGGSLLNTTQLPANCQLYGMGNKVDLSGATQTFATVYAPTADITRSGGNSDFFGMMVGKSLTLSGGGGCHFDQALDSMLGVNGAQLVK